MRLPHHPLWLIALGPLLWSAHFVLIYTLLSVGCAAGWQTHSLAGIDLIRFLLLGVTAAVVAALLALLLWAAMRLRRGGKEADRFTQGSAAGATLLALIAVLWEALAVPLLAPCL